MSLISDQQERKKTNCKAEHVFTDLAVQTLQTKTNPGWNLSSHYCCPCTPHKEMEHLIHGLWTPAEPVHFLQPCAIWLPLPSLQDKEHELTYHSVVEVIRQHPLTHSNQQPKSFFLFGIQQQHRGQNIHRLTRAKRKWDLLVTANPTDKSSTVAIFIERNVA